MELVSRFSALGMRTSKGMLNINEALQTQQQLSITKRHTAHHLNYERHLISSK